jgi:hypothetical protein
MTMARVAMIVRIKRDPQSEMVLSCIQHRSVVPQAFEGRLNIEV